MLKTNKIFSGFSVSDLGQAKDFYSKVLGLPTTETKEGLQLDVGNGCEVFVYPKSNHTPATYTIMNFVVDNIEQSVDELVTHGVIFEQYDDPHMKTDAKGISRGNRMAIAWFKDPAGNFLSLIQNKIN